MVVDSVMSLLTRHLATTTESFIDDGNLGYHRKKTIIVTVCTVGQSDYDTQRRKFTIDDDQSVNF